MFSFSIPSGAVWMNTVGGAPVKLGQLVFGPGQADFEAFDFAKPTFQFGFRDPGNQVVADLDETPALSGVGPEESATHTRVFVGARGLERSPTGPYGDLPPLEAPEEGLPFFLRGGAVLFARP